MANLKDIPPDAKGIPLRQWETKEIRKQCDEAAAAAAAPDNTLLDKPVATGRDNYGRKSSGR